MKLLQPKTKEIVEIEKVPVRVRVPATGGSWVL